MKKVGFDNEKYLKMQSEQIRRRLAQFGGKLYLEFGGKLFDDFTPRACCPALSRTARCACCSN